MDLGNRDLPFLIGGGQMGELIRNFNWEKNPLGSPKLWPSSLKQTVSLMLTTTFPALICWGEDYIQLYNDAFVPINGITKHPQALGNAARITYNEIWATIEPMLEKVMQGESVGYTNFGLTLNRNGVDEDCFFNFSYSPIRDEEGKIRGVLVICTETTAQVYTANMLVAANEELVQTQYDLQRSEKMFKSIALNIPNSLIIVIDKNHRFVTIEGDIMAKMGYDGRDYTGKHPTEVSSAERYEIAKHLYEKMLAGEKFSIEQKSEDTGDNYMVHFVPLKNDKDEVEAGLIITLEITDFKYAEERSAKFAAIIESSDDAIISKTLESVITSWNDSAVRMFGYSAEEIIGETIYKLIPEDRQDEEPKILARLKSGDRVEHFETKRLTKDGKLIDVSLTISPVKDKTGKIIGLSKIIRDITFKKQEEQRKNDFVAMVSHELKTPLTTIHSYMQLLLAKSLKDEDEFYIKALTRSEVQTKRMTAMINDFLNVARLEVGEISIHKSKFELNTLIQEIVREVQFLTTKHEIGVLGSDEVFINGDRDKLGQVFNNLLTNAIKYSPNGGCVTVGYKIQDKKVKIYVKDKGVGIKLDDQKRLFERFYRAEDDKLKMVSGFGIGLYLVSEILRYHDSKIEVDSEENLGSTFHFTLNI